MTIEISIFNLIVGFILEILVFIFVVSLFKKDDDTKTKKIIFKDETTRYYNERNIEIYMKAEDRQGFNEAIDQIKLVYSTCFIDDPDIKFIIEYDITKEGKK